MGSPLTALRALLKNYFVAIIGAAIVAFLLRVYVMEAFRIPTDLMAPTLLSGDHIFVNKLAYTAFLGGQTPERGDVVVFSMPSDPTKDYIKRVIGLAGDRVEIRDGKILLNGETISHLIDADTNEERLGERKFTVQWTSAAPESRNMLEVTVPPDNVFVLGDHRAKGQDSRTWGFLPSSALKGRATFVWFSMGTGKGLEEGVRWSRIFTKVK